MRRLRARGVPLAWALAVGLSLLSGLANAGERSFPATWTPDLAPAEVVEASLWVAPRLGRTQAYTALDTRLLLLTGLGRSLEVGAALEAGWAVDERQRVQQAEPRLSGLAHLRFLEAGPFRASVLGRVGAGTRALELEARLAADVTVDAVRVAVNLLAQGRLWRAGGDEVALRLESSLGLHYLLPLGLAPGLEVRVRHALGGQLDYLGTAVLAGPSFSFRAKGFWLTASAWAQVAQDRAPADRASPEPLEFRDNERFGGALVVGVTFG